METPFSALKEFSFDSKHLVDDSESKKTSEQKPPTLIRTVSAGGTVFAFDNLQMAEMTQKRKRDG